MIILIRIAILLKGSIIRLINQLYIASSAKGYLIVLPLEVSLSIIDTIKETSLNSTYPVSNINPAAIRGYNKHLIRSTLISLRGSSNNYSERIVAYLRQ